MKDPVTVALQSPIKAGGATFEALDLREPTGADLRGIMLVNLLQGSTAAVAKLAARVAAQPVAPEQIELLPAGDQVRIWTAIIGFFGDGATPSTDGAAGLGL
jgi:hypothetical protein